MSGITIAHYDDWFHARTSGNYSQARWLIDQLKPHQGKSTLNVERKSLLKRLELWEKAYKRGTVLENLRLERAKRETQRKTEEQAAPEARSVSTVVSVAPAAIDSETDRASGSLTPRMGNTGGTSITGDITSRVSTYRAIEETLKLYKGESLTKVDWVSVSFPTVQLEDEQRLLWAQFADLLERVGIAIVPRGKGHHGYTDSAALEVCEPSGKARNVGMLAWSDKQGYFIELSGLGCDHVLRECGDFYTIVVAYGGRLSRADIALDLFSEYCFKQGFTVPRFAQAVTEGDYRSIYTPKNAKQSINYQGDWGPIICGSVTASTYDPFEYSPRGLTVYAGSSKSDNQVVFYEKGKQLLAGVPEKAADEFLTLLSAPELSEQGKERFTHLRDLYGIDPEKCRERGWVRVERRMRRGSNKKHIPPEILLDPDSAFCDSFDGLTDLLQGYSQYVKREYTDLKSFKRVLVEKSEVIDLTKKIYYARQHAGRLIKTLLSRDYSAGQIIDQLSGPDGYPVEDVIFDLLE